MTAEQAFQLLSIAAMFLAGTWRLSSQISKIDAKLEGHIEADRDKFKEVDDTLNIIAPRAVRLVKTGR